MIVFDFFMFLTGRFIKRDYIPIKNDGDFIVREIFIKVCDLFSIIVLNFDYHCELLLAFDALDSYLNTCYVLTYIRV